MAPVLTEGTIVVLKPIDFGDLEVGMDVGYTMKTGEPVIHRLMEKWDGGWVVQGLNNPAPDPDLVTSDNLLGVLLAVFYNQGEAEAVFGSQINSE